MAKRTRRRHRKGLGDLTVKELFGDIPEEDTTRSAPFASAAPASAKAVRTRARSAAKTKVSKATKSRSAAKTSRKGSRKSGKSGKSQKGSPRQLKQLKGAKVCITPKGAKKAVACTTLK